MGAAGISLPVTTELWLGGSSPLNHHNIINADVLPKDEGNVQQSPLHLTFH